jgi:hypothetical protein
MLHGNDNSAMTRPGQKGVSPSVRGGTTIGRVLRRPACHLVSVHRGHQIVTRSPISSPRRNLEEVLNNFFRAATTQRLDIVATDITAGSISPSALQVPPRPRALQGGFPGSLSRSGEVVVPMKFWTSLLSKQSKPSPKPRNSFQSSHRLAFPPWSSAEARLAPLFQRRMQISTSKHCRAAKLLHSKAVRTRYGNQIRQLWLERSPNLQRVFRTGENRTNFRHCTEASEPPRGGRYDES